MRNGGSGLICEQWLKCSVAAYCPAESRLATLISICHAYDQFFDNTNLNRLIETAFYRNSNDSSPFLIASLHVANFEFHSFEIHIMGNYQICCKILNSNFVRHHCTRTIHWLVGVHLSLNVKLIFLSFNNIKSKRELPQKNALSVLDSKWEKS